MTSISSNTTRTQLSLARRILFQNTTGDLPQLLGTTNIPHELHTELYDFIALSLRAYINPWWTKISRYDREFLPQITRILTVVIRSLESRLLTLDLASLIFQDAPMILIQHYRDYRNAASNSSSSHGTSGPAPVELLFHQLQPHIAISIDGSINPEYFRQIVNHILSACLPPEDHTPDSERLIVREVIVKVLVDDLIPKISQPWFIQRIILDLLESNEQERLFKPLEQSSQSTGNHFSFHTLIVVVLSALQSFSTTCLALIHAYKQAITTIRLVNQSPTHTPRPGSPPLSSPQPPTSHTAIEQSSLPQKHQAQHISHSKATSSAASSISYPSQSVLPQSLPDASFSEQDPSLFSIAHIPPHQPVPVQYVRYASLPLTLLSEVFLTQERLAATTLFLLLRMASTCMTPFLDKLLPHLLHTTLSPSFILNIVRLSKRTMFPNGYPGPPPVEPTLEEQLEIRDKLVKWRGKGPMSHITPFFLGADPSHTLSAAIDPLTSQSCNIHLIITLLDRIVVALFPELTCSGNGALGVHDVEMATLSKRP